MEVAISVGFTLENRPERVAVACCAMDPRQIRKKTTPVNNGGFMPVFMPRQRAAVI